MKENWNISDLVIRALTKIGKLIRKSMSNIKLENSDSWHYLKRFRVLVTVFFLNFTVYPTFSDEDSFRTDLMSDYTEFVYWLKKVSDEKKIPGAAVAIVSREEVKYLQTWGLRENNTSKLVTPESIFRIASMSKTFAGTSAAMLVERDLQSWDAKLTDIFPTLILGNKASSGKITLRHIASQSTGLMPHSYSNLLDEGVVYGKIKQKFHEIPTVCAPGKCYGYQNVVFSLIGDIVETSTGKTYGNFVEQEIFKPLGMTTATVGLDAFKRESNATTPHRFVRESWRPTTNNPAYYSVAPASGINASILDMAIWVRANLGAFPDIMSPDFLSSVHEPVIKTPYGNYFNRWANLDDAYYGLGWRVFDYDGMRVVHHGGGVRGFRSEMAFVPERNIGLVLLLNAASNLANDVVPQFLDNLNK